ncbi:hypothetical protein H9P43_007004 [Blastocladiella emersonii ATCC 22665]|nr:hypothetical protein H9P43_007004 [Blastocladiella emersonii ATCC 22665]
MDSTALGLPADDGAALEAFPPAAAVWASSSASPSPLPTTPSGFAPSSGESDDDDDAPTDLADLGSPATTPRTRSLSMLSSATPATADALAGDLGDRSALHPPLGPGEAPADPGAYLAPSQRYPVAGLVHAAVQDGYDVFDAAGYKSVHVALQAYGGWAHKLATRIDARLGVSPDERTTLSRLARHGITPMDLAAGLVPPPVLDRWRLDRKREQEEALRRVEEEERRRVREAAAAAAAAKKRAAAKSKKRVKRAAGDASETATGAGAGDALDSDDDGDVPLPDYAALPGDAYFPDQEALPNLELEAPGEDDDDEVDVRDASGRPSTEDDTASAAARSSQSASPNPWTGSPVPRPGRAAQSPSPSLARVQRGQSPMRGRAMSASNVSQKSGTTTTSSSSPSTSKSPARGRSHSTSEIPTSAAAEPAFVGPPLVFNRDDVRHAVLADLFLAAVHDGRYDARSRVVLKRVAAWLLLQPDTDAHVAAVEFAMIPHTGFFRALPSAADRDFSRDKTARSRRDRGKRMVAMAAAAVGGGLVLGLSAGLAAPLIGAGLGAAFTGVGLTGTTAFLSGTGGMTLITTGAALTGSNVARTKMGKRMGGVNEFGFYPVAVTQRMNVVVSIGGWLAKTDEQASDLSLPFSVLEAVEGDHFSVIWEPEMLRELGSALKMIAGEVISTAVQQALMVTMLHSLLAALAWPLALLKIGYLIDNPWQNALARAKRAGQLLADLLIQHVQEGRPVTLVAYSLGARVLLYCLLELAENKAYGLVEDVFMFGCPATPSAEQWRLARSVVAGRFVNGYVSNDWILGFLFRASSVAWSVAGLAPARAPRIEDVDLTGLVNGHLSYRVTMPRILKQVGLSVSTDDPEFLVNRDREAEHRIDEQARIAKERDAAERDARRRTGKRDVLSHLRDTEQGATSDSLSVMSRVKHETADLLGGSTESLPPSSSSVAAFPAPEPGHDRLDEDESVVPPPIPPSPWSESNAAAAPPSPPAPPTPPPKEPAPVFDAGDEANPWASAGALPSPSPTVPSPPQPSYRRF